ncbi:hypothetical protein Poli38472_000552 [Pythium oligandrum]|uniref:Uncharacterized protein n=1 Tax=Pythium oligandrum TaxID=41045 RepID=A0A8K1FEG2_PYTOL|nr:hypothetical protein Poli38472_000552 [Pythium oligandrum]|eukprot:TMW60510.1 hypothetical protein Poli38472_000552 [Pythium oligandrum]
MSWLETELQDDPATLQAALALLDEMDGTPATSESSSSPEASVNATADDGDTLEIEDVKKRRGNVTRNRQRDELLYLRDKVTEMEETLKSLKRNRVPTESEGAMVASKSTQIWEEMAGRQQKQRRVVELENAKLRAALRTQLKVGKDLMRLIQKSSQVQDGTSSLVKRREITFVPAELTTEEHFARLLDLYCLTDNVFSSVPPGENITTLRDISTSEENPNTTTLVSYATWTMPFSMESVLKATWESVAREMVKKEPNFDLALDDKEDTMAAVFHWDTQIIFKWMQGEIAGTMVAQKFPHHAQNEAVVVFNLAAQLTPSLPRSFDDMKLAEDCWMRIRTVPSDSELDTVTMTQIQINRRLQLEIVTNETVSQRRKAGLLTDFVFSQAESAGKWRQEMIENLLFDSKLG